MGGMRFVVVADSHIRFPDDEIETYPSNSQMVARNEFVVGLCNRIAPDFVIHLGDIVHPLPVEEGHEPAVELAVGVYDRLEVPIHFVPGNHDIGDKPNSFVAVPAVAQENYEIYTRHWGPPFKSFNHDDCHFVLIDTPVLNSGLSGEREQKAWLESDLARATRDGRRIFLFTHYPPFVRDPEESEHYDNLGNPARAWLLDLIEQHHVEAVFSGHVHNFGYNHHSGTELYVLPSTGFVRPDYSELSAVTPESESGRDDQAKLGFFVVDVDEQGHTIRPVRTDGAILPDGRLPVPLETALGAEWTSSVGVTLRHGWMSAVDFPTAGLDEFRRKTVRNDATLLSLWEARINDLRIPVADGATRRGVERLASLAGRGARFTVVSAGVPDPPAMEAVHSLGSIAARWEIACPPEMLERLARKLPGIVVGIDMPVAVGPITPIGSPGLPVHHFVSTGFSVNGDPLLDDWPKLDVSRAAAELVFRVGREDDVRTGVGMAEQLAAEAGCRAVVLIELPRATESTVFDNDQAVADLVAGAVEAASAHPDVVIFLDGFMDHDRSYYPRHGLIDRRHNPRPALVRLIERTVADESDF